MADMVGAAGAALSPLAALLHRELISRPVVHADETTLKILNTKKGGKSCSGYLWAYVSGERTGPSVVCFDCRTGRSHEYPENWLQGWGGTLVVDGHKAYRTLANKVPELANIIGHHAGIDDNTAAKAIAHAILGGVTAALQGNSAAAGAIGAGTGEVISSAIAKSLYPDVDPSKLTEDQKQTVSTLATLSAGMAGGIASGDVAGAAAGAGVGKNIAENNLVGGTESEQSKAGKEPLGGMRQVVRWVSGLTTKIHCQVPLSMVPVRVLVMELAKDFHGVLMQGKTGGKVVGIRSLILS